MRHRARPDANHLLAAAAILIGGAALYPWLAPIPVAPIPAVTVAGGALDPARTMVKPVALPPLDSFASVLARPLFSPSRRPPANAKVASSALVGRYVLLGLVSVGDKRHALVADGERRIELAEGAAIDGWTVSRIEQDRVTLTSPAGRATLTLRAAAAAAAAAAKPTAPAAQ
jgi:general secretion pathway protein N